MCNCKKAWVTNVLRLATLYFQLNFSFLLHTLLVIFVNADVADLWLNENQRRKIQKENG